MVQHYEKYLICISMNINENVKKIRKIRQKMIKLLCITNPGTESSEKNGMLRSQQ